MRSARAGFLLLLLFRGVSAWAQQATPVPPSTSPPAGSRQVFQLPFTPPSIVRDQQALTVLQNAISAMGNAVPGDSVATGSVTIVAGTKTDDGTVRITTRGTESVPGGDSNIRPEPIQ